VLYGDKGFFFSKNNDLFVASSSNFFNKDTPIDERAYLFFKEKTKIKTNVTIFLPMKVYSKAHISEILLSIMQK
jgi:hypothetical protein